MMLRRSFSMLFGDEDSYLRRRQRREWTMLLKEKKKCEIDLAELEGERRKIEVVLDVEGSSLLCFRLRRTGDDDV